MYTCFICKPTTLRAAKYRVQDTGNRVRQNPIAALATFGNHGQILANRWVTIK
jgi:hypothetical protein